MILDAQNLFSNAQAVSVLGSTDSTNVIDLGVARDIGGAVTEDLDLLAQVVTAFASGGAATLKVQVKGSTDNSTWTTLYQSDDIPVASLVQGYKWLQGPLLSYLSGSPQRYLKLTYVIGTASMTAGAITAGFAPALQHVPNYSIGYTA